MSSGPQYISVGKEQLHYLKWGSGRRLLLAFHGYGEDAEHYSLLSQSLTGEYTILSFDLPHHGGSKWTDGAVLEKQELAAMVKVLLAEYKVDKVSLIGNSMGGRVCLAILECMPACIDKVTLIATDGLEVNFYFYFFTRTFIGKIVFRNLLEKPRNYIWAIDWLKDKKLVDTSRHKFVMHFLHSGPGREMLLRVWPSMRDVISRPEKLKAAIRKYKIPVSVFMGANDKIMPPLLAEKFKRGLDTVQLHVLDKGHRILDNENAQQIAESLL